MPWIQFCSSDELCILYSCDPQFVNLYKKIVGRQWKQIANHCHCRSMYELLIHRTGVILLMAEILHHLGCIKPCTSWDNLPFNWCRISSINSRFGDSIKWHDPLSLHLGLHTSLALLWRQDMMIDFEDFVQSFVTKLCTFGVSASTWYPQTLQCTCRSHKVELFFNVKLRW